MYQLELKNKTWTYTDHVLERTFSVPSGWEASLAETPAIPAIQAEAEIAKDIQAPAYGLSLKDMVRQKGAKTACILVSDATRAVPTARLLKYVVEDLTASGISYENIHAFVAIGVHREATPEEMQTFLGDLYGRISIENHTPFDKNNLVFLGNTSRNTPVWVNKKAYACDLHIQIGKVEPHEFAGFSGGRKSVLPGISSEETILVNHRPEMILKPQAGIGLLKGNPVHEDMLETAEKFRIDFGVNCILNNSLKISAVFAGDMKKSHEAAVNFVRDRLGVTMQKPDILVTTPGQPLDIDFYQSVKALIALTEVLSDQTVVVLYCGCPEGVNSPDMLRAFRSGKNLEDIVDFTTKNYKIQMDHVLLLSKILQKNVKILVYCPNISNQEIRDMTMIPCHSTEEAMTLAAELTGKETGTILFYPRPQTGLPVLE